MTDTVTLPADWAIEQALRAEYGDNTPPNTVSSVKKAPTTSFFKTVVALARMIEQHEEPPVDPDLILAREICSKTTASKSLMYASKRCLSGEWDHTVAVLATLSGIKEGRKLGSE